jgi:hypothetical protein
MWTVDCRSDGLDQHNYKSLKTILIVHFKSDSYNTKQRQTVEKETLENLFALKEGADLIQAKTPQGSKSKTKTRTQQQ